MWKLLAVISCLLATAENATAQKFNRIYNTVDRWDFAISICATRDGGSVELGYSGFNPTSATVVTRLNANGAVLWARTYSRAIWRVVRQTSDGGFVLFGDDELSMNPQRIVPKIIKIDPNGQFQWGREFLPTNHDGTPGNYAVGLALTIEPRTGDLLVGGAFYPQPLFVYEPWLAKLDANGNKIWLVAYANEPANVNTRVLSVVSPQQGGLIGVGDYYAPAANLHQLFVVKVNPNGTPGGYQSYAITGQSGGAYIDDVVSMLQNDRSRIVGTIDNFKFCNAGFCLKQLNSVALTAELNETNLALTAGLALWDQKAQYTLANSVEVDIPLGAFFIGGQSTSFTPKGAALRQALFIESAHSGTGFIGRRYGDGKGRFSTNLRDLDRFANLKSGFVSAVHIFGNGAAPFSGNNVVRTDMHGDSGSCQSSAPIFTTEFDNKMIERPYLTRTWDLQRFVVKVENRRMRNIPCTEVEGAGSGANSGKGARSGTTNGAGNLSLGSPAGQGNQTRATGETSAPPKCEHDFCVPGLALAADCSPEVKAVCAVDPYCCHAGWDNACVLEVSTTPAGKPPLCTNGPPAVPTPSPPVWTRCGSDFCPSILPPRGH